MKKIFKTTSTVLLSLVLFSCSTELSGITPNNNKTLIQQQKTNITGKVDFSDNNNFSLKATIDEISTEATVSILYPRNHNDFPNKTLATGLTDENGNFTINPGSEDKIKKDIVYILEATKRIGTGISKSESGKSLLSIRTFIKWTGSEWVSITTPEIMINTLTTAYTLVSPDIVNPENTLGKITIDNGIYTPHEIITTQGTIDVEKIQYTQKLIKGIMEQNLDPVQFYKSGENTGVRNEKNILARQFLETGSCESCIFEFADFSNQDFSDKDLAGHTFFESNLRNVDFNNSSLNREIFDFSDLTGANFSNAEIITSYISYSNLNNANFGSAAIYGGGYFQSNLTNVNYDDAYLESVDFSLAENFSNNSLKGAYIKDVSFGSRDFTGMVLTDATILKTYFTGSNLSKAIGYNGNTGDFSNFNLESCRFYGNITNGIKLTGANLKGVSFSNSDMSTILGYNGIAGNFSNFNLSNSKTYEVIFENSILENVNFSNSELFSSNFTNSNMKNVNLSNSSITNTNLTNVDLSNSDLSGIFVDSFSFDDFTDEFLTTIITNFSGANMQNANLSNATISDTNFSNVNLTGANLTGISFNNVILDGAIWTDGKVCATGSIDTCN